MKITSKNLEKIAAAVRRESPLEEYLERVREITIPMPPFGYHWVGTEPVITHASDTWTCEMRLELKPDEA